MPVQLYVLVGVLSLIEGFATAEIGIQRTALCPAVTVTATVAGTQLIVPSPLFQINPAADFAIAVRTAFQRQVGTGLCSRVMLMPLSKMMICSLVPPLMEMSVWAPIGPR